MNRASRATPENRPEPQVCSQGKPRKLDARRLRHAAMMFRLARVIETGTSSQRKSG